MRIGISIYSSVIGLRAVGRRCIITLFIIIVYLMLTSMGSLIGSGMNFRSTKLTNATNLQIARETNAANATLANMQNNWNIAQWNRENLYNSPAAQVGRLQEAGLSKAASSQAIEGAGNAGQLQSANLATQQMPAPLTPPQMNLDSIDSILGKMRELQAYRKEKVEADVAKSTQQYQAQDIISKADSSKASAALAWQDFNQKVKTNPYSFQKLKYEAKAAKSLPEIQKFTSKLQQQNFKLAKQQFGFLQQKNPKELEALGEQIKKTIEEAREARSRTGVNDATKGNINQATENLKTQNEGHKIENANQALEYVFKKFGMPDTAAGRFASLLADGKLPPGKVGDFLNNMKSYFDSAGKYFSDDFYQRKFFDWLMYGDKRDPEKDILEGVYSPNNPDKAPLGKYKWLWNADWKSIGKK